MIRINRSYLFVCMLAFMMVLAACSEKDQSNEDSGTKEPVAEKDDEEQVLIFARGGDSESLDPGSTSDGESSRVTRQVLEGLVEFEEESFELKPGLAHDWDVSDDGLTYTFYLEEDVTFHDGTDFNAEAVKLNFDRFADPEHEYAFAEDDYVYFMYATMFGGHKGDDGHVVDEVNVINDHRSEEHTSELQSRGHLVCRLLLEKKK